MPEKSNYFFLKYFLLFISISSYSQTQFYKSDIAFSESQLQKQQTSFAISERVIIFNAMNYYLYGISKSDSKIIWENYIGWKTTNPPKIYGKTFFHGKNENDYVNAAQFDLETGKILKTLQMEPLQTTPFFKNGILYTTAIYEGGQLLAYDISENKILWRKFIAHGSDNQPYYFKEKIIANAESDNWFEIDYNGNLLDTKCREKAQIFVEDIPCIRNFKILTHDQKELSSEFLDKNLGEDSEYVSQNSSNYTALMNDSKLIVLGKNRKKILNLDLNALELPSQSGQNTIFKILEITNQEIWFFFDNNLVQYDFLKKTMVTAYDFGKWTPLQIEKEKDSIWLISRIDNQLYGINLNQ